MRVRLFVVFAIAIAVGFVGWGAPRFQLSADQGNSPIVGAAACVADFPTAASPDPRATVVMCGLDNPRGLTFGQFALYVAEAGKGGLGQAAPLQCFIGQAGGTRCYGPSGAISRLSNGVQERVATRLPSHASLTGRAAIGPHDIALVRGADVTNGLAKRPGSQDCHPGCAYVTIGLQQPPNFRERYPFLAGFARLIEVSSAGQWRNVADLGTYEAEHDPDQIYYTPAKLDSNPYGLLAKPSGRAILVTDAGGNSLLQVDANGETSTHAVFPPHPAGSRDDSVPTSVAVGPDGAYYVGELTGFPLIPGISNIYRLGSAGDPPDVCLTGFTQIIDLDFDKQGSLYVLQYGGTLYRVTPDRSAASEGDHQRGMCGRYAAGTQEVMVTGLTNPTSVAVGPDGAVYVSNRGTHPATGQVIRFDLQDQ